MFLQYVDDHIKPLLAFANVGILQILRLQLPDFYEKIFFCTLSSILTAILPRYMCVRVWAFSYLIVEKAEEMLIR